MKTIEERAREYSLKDFDGYYTGREKAVEEGYIAGAGEQKQLTLEAFDEWLCRNSWITRDEGNRKPLEELRNIIQNMEKIDKLTKIEILVTDEGAQMFFNGYREAVPIAYPELRKAVMIMLDLCTQVQKTIIQKDKEND